MNPRNNTCPSATELVDYQEGRLPGAEKDTVRDHVNACGYCAQGVGMLHLFDVEPGTSGPAPSEADWKDFKARRDSDENEKLSARD